MVDALFKHCYFIKGENETIVIVVPSDVSYSSVLDVRVTADEILFLADYERIGQVHYEDPDVYQRLRYQKEVGVMAFREKEKGKLPEAITHMAFVQTFREELAI